MKITVTTLNDLFFTLEVDDEIELENFKALIEIETGIPSKQMVLLHEGKPLLNDKLGLKSYQINDGDVLLVQRMVAGQPGNQPQQIQPQQNAPSSLAFDFSQIKIPQQGNASSAVDQNNPAYIRDMLLSNPEQLAILKLNNSRLAEAAEQGLDEFTRVLREQQNERAELERRRIRMLVADPFDAEAQRMIAEEIQRQQIESNMETAMEYHPESYGQVAMLYINCKVNDHDIKAFVDSGAQSTIMSKACAERCNIMRLVDTRWSGIAKGVGTQRILGRIHLVQIKIENDYLATSFTILEDQTMDVMIGLDMLKRHQCCIDLKRNCLVIGTTGTETRFLDENELPEFAKHKSPASSQVDDDRALAEALHRSVAESSKLHFIKVKLVEINLI